MTIGKRNLIEPVYRITLTKDGFSHVISNISYYQKKQPFFLSVSIDVKKVPDQGLNTVNLKIYNLDQGGIPSIYTKSTTDTDIEIFVIIEFGYNINDLRILGQGKILEAYSSKEGNNVMFNLEGLEGFGQLTTAVTNFQLTPESTVGDLRQKIASRAGLNVTSDTVENTQLINKYYTINTNSPYKEMKRLFPTHEIYVEGSRIYVLSEAYINSLKANPFRVVHEITEKTNALSIPKPEGQVLEIDVILKPELQLNDTVELKLQDRYAKRFNGQYLVKGMVHTGRISYTSGTLPKTKLRLLGY